MKVAKKYVSLFLASMLALSTLSGCGSADISGEYSHTMDSLAYFSAQDVQNDMPEAEHRPDGSDAYVGLRRLMPMLDSRVTADAEVVAGAAAPASAGVSDYYTVSLSLSKGNYRLSKSFAVSLDYVSDDMKAMMDGGATPTLMLEFSGSYTSDGDVVTLEAPSQVTANISPCGGMADSYTRFGGTFRDVTETVASDVEFPGRFLHYFNTPYFVETSAPSSMTVTIDKDAGSLTFH